MAGFLSSAGRLIAHNPWAVTGIGAGLGAAAGAGREAFRAPEERNYLRGALRGGAAGLGAGAVVGHGGAAMRNTMLLRPELSGFGNIAKATGQRIGTDASHMAQRQFHGLTGYGGRDAAYLDRIGIAGTHTARQEADLARKQFMDRVPRGGHSHEDILAHTQHLQGIREQGAVAQKFRDLGMTSLPGAAKAVVTNPREASKAIWNQMTGGGGTLGKVIGVTGVAMPAALGARDIARGDESATGGRTVGEKVLGTAADVGTGLLTAGMPLGAGAIAGGLIGRGASRVGRMITPPKPLAAGAVTPGSPPDPNYRPLIRGRQL